MPTVEERMASLETRVDAMADLRNLITELRGDVNSQAGSLRAEMSSLATGLRADMNRQFTDNREDTNRRFLELREDLTESRHDVNRRLAALDEKGDRHFTWMVGTQVAVLLAVVGALVGAYFR